MKDFLSKLFNEEVNIVGLDIGLSSIKIMEVSGDNLEKVKLENYAIMPISPELLNENGDFKEEASGELSKLISKCWKKSGASSKNVAICMGGNNVITKNIIMPYYSDSLELKAAVESEFSKYIPEDINIEDLSIDYFLLGENEFNSNESDILVVATKKEKVDFLQSIVEGAGLIPEILDVEHFAIENLLKLMKGLSFYEGTYIVADCSSNMLTMYVYVNGVLIAIKETQIGGLNLTYDLINNLGISFEEAEKMKIERNGDETFDLIEKSFMNNYRTEFLSLLTYFSSANSLAEIDEIILTGGVAAIPNLEQAIIEGLLESPDVVVKNEPYIARPLDKAQKSSKLNLIKFAEEEPALFLVTSLALRKYLRKF